ncbi:MAG: O-antigen ligase family protein [Alphaproteobacteria bacterium]|nr:MAG: O-antigen ligase family protein [Alphaproteobacteria bacterium]
MNLTPTPANTLARKFFPVIPLGMVICAPLIDYFGHAAETVTSLLGLLLLIGYAVYNRTFIPAFRSAFANPSFRIGAGLVTATLLLWGYSSYHGINPDGLDDWSKILLVVIPLTLFGILARYIPQPYHHAILPAAAYIIAGLSVLVIIERFVPSLSWFLHEDLRSSRLNFAGRMLLFGLPFTLYQWHQNPKRIWMPMLVFLAIGACNGRISWFVAPVVLLLYTSFTLQTASLLQWAKLWLGSLVAFVGGTVVLALTVSPEFLSKRINDLNPEGGEGRSDIWKFALQQWESHPVFGIGVQSFRHLDFSGVTLKSGAHPHNSIVQLLLETGLVGTVAATVTISYLLYKAWKHMETSPGQRIVLFLCFVGLFGASLATTSVFHGWWMLFMLTPLAWMFAWPEKTRTL